jgi:rRNA maturation RNase YbeY
MALDHLLRTYGREPSEISVLLTTDERMRDLNRQYRGQDEATDVLTFPGPEMPGAPLGDIAISVPFAERQAGERGIPLGRELVFLALHGGLHLLGYEDETDTGRDDMVRRMNVVALELGCEPDPAWSSIHPEGGSE